MAGRYKRKDHFYDQAKEEGYRSRAAYKLIELDKRYRLLKPGNKVLDLGCYPGGWLQVAAKRLGETGILLGVDKKELAPFRADELFGGSRPIVVRGDLTSEDTKGELLRRASGRVDVILSDLSPQLSGISFRDAYLSSELVREVFRVAEDFLRDGGSLVAKIFPGPEADELFGEYQGLFQKFSRANLSSSRKSSNEYYLVARGYQRKQPELVECRA